MTALTIVIPFFKLKYFDATLASLASQSNQDFKVIVGNDCSPENPLPLIEQYRSVLDIDYVRFEENLGGKDLTQQWSRCVDRVKTEWFVILGDDDMYSEEVVAGFYDTLAQLKSTVLRLKSQLINEQAEATSQIFDFAYLPDVNDFQYQNLQGKARCSLSEYIFRTEDYRAMGIDSYEKAFYSDNMMIHKYSRFGMIQDIDKGFAKVRLSEDSLSGNEKNSGALLRAKIHFYKDLVLKYAAHLKQEYIVMYFNVLFETMYTLDPSSKLKYSAYKILKAEIVGNKLLSGLLAKGYRKFLEIQMKTRLKQFLKR